MKKHSRSALSLFLSSVLLLTLSSCGSQSSQSPKAVENPNRLAAEGKLEYTEWEKKSGIFEQNETDAELYEKAKAEGKVTIYSISSRIGKIAAAFQKKYPEIQVESFDIATNELLEKVTREYEAGQHVADVIHIKDLDGSLFEEYVRTRKFYNYQPKEILQHMKPEYTETQTPLYIELTQLFYNEEAYPDTPPVKNIWELTQEKWKGRVLMQNPLDNISWGAWITGFCVGEVPERLEQAYRDLTGEALTLSDDCPNAGYEFLKRLHKNQPVFTASSDEIAQAIGTRGQSNPPIGFSASSKIRKNKDNNWCLAAVNLIPTTGIPAINTVYVVGESEHPNAAKLLVRFLLGGSDGDTSGYNYFNTLGGWPVRDDIRPAEGSTPFDQMNVSPFMPQKIYENMNAVRDFWTLLS